MKKQTKKLFTFLLMALLVAPTSLYSQENKSNEKWLLTFEDHFKGNTFNRNNWSYAQRPTKWSSDWNKWLKASSDVVKVEDGLLKLFTIKNTTDPSDKAPYFTGGIESRGKVSFRYGKVEVRTKFAKSGQGSFPAIWLMPENPTLGWPKDGEIDIMERLNNDRQVFHTLHSNYITNLKIKDNPQYFATTPINPNIFNVYGMEWYEDRIDFTVNGEIKFTYPRITTDKEGQWPFDKEFYLIINQSAGGSWSGPITDSHLPFEMQVDWVKVYELNPDAPYEIPQWSGKSTPDSQDWKDTFVAEITATDADFSPYTTAQRPTSYYVEHTDTITVKQGKEFAINLKANSLGDYSTTAVLQDLRYTAAYIYTDYDGDKNFDTEVKVIGDRPPKDPKGGNYDVLDITQTFTAPTADKEQIGRIRVVYDNAWKKERTSANSPITEGVVHDFIIKSVVSTSDIKLANTYPITIQKDSKNLNIKGLSEKSTVMLYDVSGKIIHQQETSKSEISIQKPIGFHILKVTNTAGLHYTAKI